MNQHSIYIAIAFGFSTLILLLNWWLPLRRYRQIIQQSKQSVDESSS